MKARRNLLIGIILGVAIGWALGFLRLPYVESSKAFWVGFVACMAIVSFVLVALYAWNKNSQLLRLMGKYPTAENAKTATRSYLGIWVLVAGLIVFGGLVSSLMIHRQNELFRAQARDQDKRIQEQTETIESIRKSNMVFLMSSVLDNVDDELKDGSNRTLSDPTIASVMALAYSLKPYRYLQGDSLSDIKLSPERGQLLLSLALMRIDSGSFNKIKRNATFFGADLREADLHGADLSWVDLTGADLRDANLTGANLMGADLKDANLSGAKLNLAQLSGSDLKRADLSWAELNGADLTEADLDGVQFANARMRMAILRDASLRVANLRAALLNGANLAGADFDGAYLNRSNLTDADLTGTNLRGATLNEADLSGAELTNVTVREENWLQKLNDSGVIGAKEVQNSYKIVLDTSGSQRHHLEKLEGTKTGDT